jgi:uncharacterized membrane protein
MMDGMMGGGMMMWAMGLLWLLAIVFLLLAVAALARYLFSRGDRPGDRGKSGNNAP